MQDRWLYKAREESNPSRPSFWYLGDSNYRLKVSQRGAFFDAERDNRILARFTALEEAQRCVEAAAERKPPRKRSIKRPP
jgi:hypothetical protein